MAVASAGGKAVFLAGPWGTGLCPSCQGSGIRAEEALRVFSLVLGMRSGTSAVDTV